VFNTPFLFEQVIKDADTVGSQHDFGRNVIPSITDRYRVYAYPFRDPETGQQAYWRDVGTLDAYWQANMELISVTPQLNLYDKAWPIMTRQTQAPPAKFVFDDPDRRGEAINSMVSAGCVISGARVQRSLIFNNCYVHPYSLVEDSVVLPDVDIGERCHVRRAILDRGARIPDGMQIGLDPEADRANGFRVTESGLTLVTPDMLGQRLHFLR
jgi:glucose-1-phosphate adenylyltransferase